MIFPVYQFQKILDDPFPVRGQHRFGMELYPLDGIFPVPDAHDLAFRRFGGDFEAGGEGALARRSGNGSGRPTKGLGSPLKDRLSVIKDMRGLPVHDPLRPDDLAAEGIADGLVAQTDAHDAACPDGNA